MQVSEIMTRDVVTVRPETPFKEVVDLLVRRCVSGAPVIDHDGTLVGVITEADLLCPEAYPDCHPSGLAVLTDVLRGEQHVWVAKAGGSTASDMMTATPMTCAPADEVREVARRLLKAGIKRLPVVEDGHLVGVVARHDILAIFDQPDDAIAAGIERLLSENSNSMWEDHNLRCEVEEGTVTLVGDVRCEQDTRVVAAMVQAIPGVIHVVNKLHWREASPTTAAGESFDEARSESIERWTYETR